MLESEHYCVKYRRIWLAQLVLQAEEEFDWQVWRCWSHHGVTTGQLISLEINATNEALEAVHELGGIVQNIGLVRIGPICSWIRSRDGIVSWTQGSCIVENGRVHYCGWRQVA